MADIWRLMCCACLLKTLWLGVPVQCDDYIVVSVSGGIYMYSGDGDNITSTSPTPQFTTMGMPSADINSMEVNIDDGSIFFLDRASRCIYLYSNDTNAVTSIRCGISQSIYSTIAYDWLGRNIYWTDGFFNWIAVQPVNTNDTSIYRVLIQNNMEKPRAISVDPVAGLMFWFDLSPWGYRIERASLDGTDRRLVITQSLLSVHDIVADCLTSRLYWTDAKRFTIESSNYDGSDRQIVYKRSDNYFRSISIDMNYVCATTFDGQSWRCIHKTTGNVQVTRVNEFSASENPRLISIYKQDTKPSLTDDCPSLGCEHLCVKLATGSKCLCKEGYVMDPTGTHCVANNDMYGKGLFLCNDTNICMWDYRVVAGYIPPLLCLNNTVQGCRHLAVDVATGTVFYADSVSNTINGYHLKTNVIGSLTAAFDVTGLTFDWTDGHLYWSEANSGQVKSYSFIDNNVDIVHQATSPPSLVTVDPHSRTLYWVENMDGSIMRIKYKSLTNSSTGVLQSSSSPIISLYRDVTTDRLFYVDNNILKTSTRNGTYVTAFPFDMTNIRHMVIYKRFVIWEDGSGFLKSIPTQYFSRDETSLPGTFGPVTGMAVYDEAVQQPSINLCRDMKGECDHFCFIKPTGDVGCKCDFGFELQPDQKSCSSVLKSDNFILATDFGNRIIYQISTLDAHINAVNLPMAVRPLSAVYDHTASHIYWSDVSRGQIIRASIDGTNQEAIYTSEDGDDLFPTYLALDSSTGNIYATITFSNTASDAGKIIAVHPSTKSVKTIVPSLNVVNGHALFPSKGALFYVNRNSSGRYIFRMSMDGTNPRDIVSLSTNGYIFLAIDYIGEKLYWSSSQGVSYSDLDGQNQAVLFNDVNEILAIQILDNFLFYTSNNIHKIVKYNLVTGLEVPFMVENAHIGIIYDTFIQPRPIQSESSECSATNGGCSTFCLPREITTGDLCACSDGVNAKPGDPTSCENDVLCEDNILHGMVSSTCKARALDVCTVDCFPGYRNTVPTLTCMTGGQWNVDPQTVCEDKCPANTIFDIWRLWMSCGRAHNESCQYDCATGYTKQFDMITCNVGNVWSETLAQLCVLEEGNRDQQNTASSSSSGDDVSAAYFGVAGTAALLLIVFLITLGVCLMKRRNFRKQMKAKQNQNATPSGESQPVPSYSTDVAEGGVFNDMRNFHSPLPPKEGAEMYPDPSTWDKLRDAIALDVPGESSDFDFDDSSPFKNYNTSQPFSVFAQAPPISPQMVNNTGKSTPEHNENAIRRIASESAIHSPKEKPKLDKSLLFAEDDARPSTTSYDVPKAKPPMRRASSAFSMRVPAEPPKSAERPPMRRTTSVASMVSIPEEPVMRRTNSELFPKPAGTNRRRAYVVSSLGDQLNTRRSSSSGLEKSIPPQKRRASVACIPSQDTFMRRGSSSNSLKSLQNEGLKRSSVVSIKRGFEEQSEISRRSSVSQESSDSGTRRSSIVPVETIDVGDEEEVFE